MLSSDVSASLEAAARVYAVDWIGVGVDVRLFEYVMSLVLKSKDGVSIATARPLG